jgi:chromosome segregation ATPase
VANTAAPPVLDLCDGVIRAMILSKLKLTAAVVMTLGLVGGGAGWVALSPGGTGVALADGPQAKADEPRRTSAEDEQRRTEMQIERLHKQLAEAEDRLVMQETERSQIRVDARLRLAAEEERYKDLERRVSQLQPVLDLSLVDLQEKFRQMRAHMGNDNPSIAALQEQIKAVEQANKQSREKVEKERNELSAALMQARRNMVKAEEDLSLFDRMSALKRRAGQAQVEDLQDRIRQLRGGPSGGDSVDRRVRDLDRKLDDVLRELTELRRELKK